MHVCGSVQVWLPILLQLVKEAANAVQPAAAAAFGENDPRFYVKVCLHGKCAKQARVKCIQYHHAVSGAALCTSCSRCAHRLTAGQVFLGIVCHGCQQRVAVSQSRVRRVCWAPIAVLPASHEPAVHAKCISKHAAVPLALLRCCTGQAAA